MTLRVDRVSLLAETDGAARVGELEDALSEQGLTLDLRGLDGLRSLTVNEWLAGGARGTRDPWLDPADHVIAGLEARLVGGQVLRVAPAPRRSVGPDLVTLMVGTGGRFGEVSRAFLRVHPRGVARPETAPFTHEPDPPLSPPEARLLGAIEQALRGTTARR